MIKQADQRTHPDPVAVQGTTVEPARFVAETGLRNWVLLSPIDAAGCDYAFVNHAHWDAALPQVMWRQLSNASFRTLVLPMLRVHHMAAMAFHHAAPEPGR